MNNTLQNTQDKKNNEKEEEKKPIKVTVVKGFEPFGIDSPIPKDTNEIKRQLGLKK